MFQPVLSGRLRNLILGQTVFCRMEKNIRVMSPRFMFVGLPWLDSSCITVFRSMFHLPGPFKCRANLVETSVTGLVSKTYKKSWKPNLNCYCTSHMRVCHGTELGKGLTDLLILRLYKKPSTTVLDILVSLAELDPVGRYVNPDLIPHTILIAPWVF